MQRVLPIVLFTTLGVGCASSLPQRLEHAPVERLEELHIVARAGEGNEISFETYDAAELFRTGSARVEAGECAEALARFERLWAEFPGSRFRSPSFYNAGLCFHRAGEVERAISFFERLLRDPERAEGDVRQARLQLAQALLGLDRFAAALELIDRTLLDEGLESTERLEAMARRAQALLGLGQFAEAERQARTALRYFRTRRGDEVIDEPYFAGAANFTLAEAVRRRSETIEVPEADALTQHEALERRATLFLVAQREYFNTMRFRNAEWSAAAGFAIGAMYHTLWEAIVRAPIPPPSRRAETLDLPEYRRQFRRILGDRVRPLLRHAVNHWEQALLMIERTGVTTEWRERTESELAKIRELLMRDTDPNAGRRLDAPSATEPS